MDWTSDVQFHALNSLRQKPRDVVVGHGDHEKNDECDADSVEELHGKTRRVAPRHRFDSEEKEAAAVERGDGQKIDDGEIDGDERGERQDVAQSILRRLTDDADEAHRPDDVFERRWSVEKIYRDGTETAQNI